MIIRPEMGADAEAIRAVTTQAFAEAPHASHSEARIVDALREAGALALSLVAEAPGGILGHAAFSPVTIAGEACGWFGLGPVSVLPAQQGRGIGSSLIREGLRRSAPEARRAASCLAIQAITAASASSPIPPFITAAFRSAISSTWFSPARRRRAKLPIMPASISPSSGDHRRAPLQRSGRF